MRVIFSRKGFDSSAGGAPSPIIDGRPISLPIPERPPSPTTYEALGLGDHVERVTRGRIHRSAHCHDDPLFADGFCWFGQSGAAQGHLRKEGVGVGDVFLFFGLFADPLTNERHHRLFGYMRVACCGDPEEIRKARGWREPSRLHPHLSDKPRRANMLYVGPATLARVASEELRLTHREGPLNRWKVPYWLAETGLSYNRDQQRWLERGVLDSAKRGQEFVSDIGDRTDAHEWLARIIAEIEA